MSTIWTFDGKENKHNVYSGEEYMKMGCKSLREHAMKIINFKKKKMMPLTNEEQKSYLNQANCHICKRKFEDKYTNDKKYHRVRDHCYCTGKYRGATHSICNLKYSIPKEILVVFRNGSNYVYHFIIKELKKEFEGEFNCLGENTEKYKTFSVPITKEVKRMNKNAEETTKTIPYSLQFTDSARFMGNSLSNLVDNLAEGILKIKCKYGHGNEKWETCGIKYKDWEFCLEYTNVKDDLTEYKCLHCSSNYQKTFDENLKKPFTKRKIKSTQNTKYLAFFL